MTKRRGCVWSHEQRSIGACDFGLLQPVLEFGCGPQAECLTQILRVMKGSRLVAEHDVIRARNAHDVINTGCAQEGQKSIRVILVGIGVVRVADVTAHWQTEQFSAEMVLQARPNNLLSLIQIY